MTAQEDSLYTTKEAATYTGYSVGTLQNMRVLGGGPKFIKPRKKVFYPKSELDAWLNASDTSRTTAQARLKSQLMGANRL